VRIALAVLLTCGTALAQPGLAPVIDPAPVAAPLVRPIDPPVNWAYMVGNTLLGPIVSFGGGLAGGLIGWGLSAGASGCGHIECNEPFIGALVGASIGVVATTSWVAYRLGARNGVDGSVTATVAGSTLGLVAGFAIAQNASNEGVAWLSVLVLPAFGASLGFTLTREWSSPPQLAMPAPRLSTGTTVLPLFAGSF